MKLVASNYKKIEFDKISLTIIIPHISYSVLKKISEVKTALDIQIKILKNCFKKKLFDHIYFFKQFFLALKWSVKDIDANLDMFNHMVLTLANSISFY